MTPVVTNAVHATMTIPSSEFVVVVEGPLAGGVAAQAVGGAIVPTGAVGGAIVPTGVVGQLAEHDVSGDATHTAIDGTVSAGELGGGVDN